MRERREINNEGGAEGYFTVCRGLNGEGILELIFYWEREDYLIFFHSIFNTEAFSENDVGGKNGNSVCRLP